MDFETGKFLERIEVKLDALLKKAYPEKFRDEESEESDVVETPVRSRRSRLAR